MASEPKQNTSVWLALRNPAFVALWLPSVVSGVCIAAHDTAATWLMNALGASPLLLSLIATAASLPFFLFTLPAGAVADLSNRRNLLIAVYLWLAAAAGLLAVCTWLHWVHPYIILTTVFLLGIGFAFNAPVWASIVPEIAQKKARVRDHAGRGADELGRNRGSGLRRPSFTGYGPGDALFSKRSGLSNRGVGDFATLPPPPAT
jgi:MFS family permease